MLVLSRKKSEVIVVSGCCPDAQEIRIVVLEIGNGQVKLGIEAPRNVPVYRMEIWQRMQPKQSIVSPT